MYSLKFSTLVVQQLLKLQRSEPVAYKKTKQLLEELKEHPHTGTGHPEPLKGRHKQFSRRISHKHRLIYSILEEDIEVLILSAYGHYEDK